MYYFHEKVLHGDLAMRRPLMVINKTNASTCNDSEEFTADENFLLYLNLTVTSTFMIFTFRRLIWHYPV